MRGIGRYMFCNFFVIDSAFIERFEENQQRILSDFAYQIYVQRLKCKSKRLPKEKYFLSNRVHYSLVYMYCPKCKVTGFLVNHLSKKQSSEFKFCPHCGEPNINYRYNVGRGKIIALLQLSRKLSDDGDQLSRILCQKILISICSIFEVYLREFYADILNTKFIRSDLSLYDKFVSDCKNDFLNPGKTQERLKRDLNINYKDKIGHDIFKSLVFWADCRNVIVHNNGICDKRFVKKYPDYELRSELIPNWQQTTAYLCAVDVAVKNLDQLYSSILLEAIVHELKSALKNGDLTSQKV